jgi:copper chaperone NosL
MKRAWIVAALAGALGACQGEPLSGPPTLHLGRDECASCGMIINEAKCSCALLVQEGGEREYRVFDDIGCMLEYGRQHEGTLVVSRFVHDYATGAWIDARAGSFLVAPEGRLVTPMGSGIVAFAQRSQAEQKQRDTAGALTGLDDLPAAVSARK